MARTIVDPLIRFIAMVRVDDVTGCWNWAGFRDKDGYGFFLPTTNPDDRERAHRWSYTFFTGESIVYEIDHNCNNPSCVNPRHLSDLPHRDNILRSERAPTAIHARQQLCKRGHPFLERQCPRRGIRRYCPTCAANYYESRGRALRQKQA